MSLFYIVGFIVKVHGALSVKEGSLRNILNLERIYGYLSIKSFVIRTLNAFSRMGAIGILFYQ